MFSKGMICKVVKKRRPAAGRKCFYMISKERYFFTLSKMWTLRPPSFSINWLLCIHIKPFICSCLMYEQTLKRERKMGPFYKTATEALVLSIFCIEMFAHSLC